MLELRVRPRVLEWLSLVLWPPVCVYAAYIVLAIVSGAPDKDDHAAWSVLWHRSIVVGACASVLVIVGTIVNLLRYGYWTMSERGVTRGLVASLHLDWSDIEAYVIGMPPQLPLLLRILKRVPTSDVQTQVSVISHHRSQAIVLRLRGQRLLPVGLVGKAVVGGELFRAELLRRLSGKEQPESSYTAAERIALARIKYARLLEVDVSLPSGRP